MTATLKSNLAQLAQMVAAGQATTRLGTVTSYDPDTYSAKVMLQPNEIETGWLPVASDWVGDQWGLFCPPSQGDQVVVVFQEADRLVGIIVKRLFNDVERPLSVQSGEFWLVHKGGSFLKFTNDGNVSLNVQQDFSTVVGGNMTCTVAGDATWNITGKFKATATEFDLTGPVIGTADATFNGISVDNHTHSDPQGGNVGPPA